jgi:predicted neuraminidase
MKTEFLFEDPPFASCHGATIVPTNRGLIAAWFGGEIEGSPDVSIWISQNGGTGWSPPMEVATGQEKGQRYACWNPVLFTTTTDQTLLFYKVGRSPRSWWGRLIKSDDAGRSWSQSQRLPDGILGPIKNKPVQFDDGTLLCGSSSEEKGWTVHMEITSDLGKSWTRTAPLNDGRRLAAIQPTILCFPSGSLQILCRTQQGKIAESRSENQGQSWTRMELMSLPNPDSGIDGVVLRDGRALLVYNHSTTERTPLNLGLSQDGKNWHIALTLEENAGEYSYPAIVQSSDEMVHIVYTWNRTRIRHTIINPKEIG